MEDWLYYSLAVASSLAIAFQPFLLSKLRPARRSDAAAPPPPLPPAVPELLIIFQARLDLHSILLLLQRRREPIFTLHYIAPEPSIIVRDRAAAHRALVQAGSTFADRPVRELSIGQCKISSASYGPLWRALRRNLTAGVLHPARVRGFASARWRALSAVLAHVETQRCKNDGENVVVAIESFHVGLFQLAVDMCFGEGVVDDEGRVCAITSLVREFTTSLVDFQVLNMYPRLSRLVFRRRWRRLLSIRRRQEELFVPLIKARRDDGDARELGCSYVDSLLRLRVPGNEEDHGGAGRSLTDVEMASMCFEFLFAATDTTAAAMQWIMARLVKHPEVQQRLREEVEREAAGHGDVHDDDLARMLYLKAVVLEALRRHPPAQIVGAHAPTREDTVLDGYRVPRDAAVNFAAAEFGWDAEAWAAPMEFRPERFLPGGEAADVDLTGAKGIKMMPFGAGRRMCPGMALALAHLEYFVANLVREFEWHAVSGEEVDLAEKMELSVGMRRPLRARVVPRRAGDRSD